MGRICFRNRAIERRQDLRQLIKSITDFGIFIGLEGNIDGLVHLSDISWNLKLAKKRYATTRKVRKSKRVCWRSIRSGRGFRSVSSNSIRIRSQAGWPSIRRIRWSRVLSPEVDARGATVDLGDGVFGSLRASELARGRVEDARTMIKVGEEIEAKFTNVDRKNRTVALSIKAKEVHEEAEALSSYKSESDGGSASTTLGELLKEKMSGGAK